MAQFTVNALRFDPYKNFKFRIKWDGKYVAGLSKMSALKRTTKMIEHREGGEHGQRDHLLNSLELRRGIDRAAPAVGRHGQAILDECDQPARHDHAGERHLLEAQVSVPRDRHEHVGAEQHQDRQHIR